MAVQLNADVLELIFKHLDFRSLCNVEMTCKLWKEVVNSRRLFWQLSKRLSAQMVPKFVNFPASEAAASSSNRKWKDFRPERRKKLRNFAPIKKYGHKNNRNSSWRKISATFLESELGIQIKMSKCWVKLTRFQGPSADVISYLSYQ